jgi:hypothetical protein
VVCSASDGTGASQGKSNGVMPWGRAKTLISRYIHVPNTRNPAGLETVGVNQVAACGKEETLRALRCSTYSKIAVNGFTHAGRTLDYRVWTRGDRWTRLWKRGKRGLDCRNAAATSYGIAGYRFRCKIIIVVLRGHREASGGGGLIEFF